MSEILKEEIEFSQTVSSTRIDEEQRKIIQLVRRLNDEGRIVLKPAAGPQVEILKKAEMRKVGMPYKQDTVPEKTEAVKSPTSSTKPETSAIERLLADRKLRMKKKKLKMNVIT